MKKWLAMLLSIVLTVQLAVPAWAADGGAEQPETVSGGYTEVDPAETPAPEPTVEPTAEPTDEPTPEPTEVPARVRFVCTPEELTLAVYPAEGDVDSLILPEEDGSYLLTPGTYAYLAAAEGYETAEGSFTVEETAEEQPVEIVLIPAVVMEEATEPALLAVTTVDSGTCGDNLTWKLNSSGTLTISGTGRMHDYLSSFTGETTAPWISYKNEIKSAKIGSGVTYIGTAAFRRCTSLTSVTIPNSVTTIGEYAFSMSGLTSVTIPGSVTFMGRYAFSCDNLASVTISEGVTSIGNLAFISSGLTSITIPKSVTSIGNSAFSGCPSVKTITVTKGNSVYYSAGNCLIKAASKELVVGCQNSVIPTDGSVTSIGDSAFSGCIGLTSVTIPEGVTSIRDSAFSGCIGLTSVTVPEGVTNIGSYAFSSCSYLGSVTIPRSVTSIGSAAFTNCDRLYRVYISDMAAWCGIDFSNDGSNPLSQGCNLYLNGELVTNLVIPEGVTGIGNYAFYGYRSLTSITIPASVTSIGGKAFVGCSSVETISVAEGNRVYHSDGNCLIQTADKKLIVGCQNSVIPTNGSVTSIGNSAFSGCSGLTSFTIPASITSIGTSAFSGCRSLTRITIPASVTSVGTSAFSSCSSLTSVTILDGVTSIGDTAFYYCENLKSVMIPKSLTSIGGEAFRGCTSLTDVYYAGTEADWKKITIKIYNTPLSNATKHYNATPVASGKCGDNLTWVLTDDGVLTISGTGKMSDYPADTGAPWFGWRDQITSVVIKSGAASIGSRAFCQCNKLTSITIPDGVASIGDFAFSPCSSLASITIPDSVTTIGKMAFNGCKSLADDNGFVIVRDVLYDYYGAGGAAVTIPSGVTRIDNSAFFNDTITGVTIPDSVTSIGNAAFYDCSSLKTATIPDSVTSIGNKAFSGCSNLTSVKIPASMTSIEDETFRGCSSLTSVEIPASVTSVGKSAFYGCTSLKDVYYTSCSETGWKNITIGSYNDPLQNATVHYLEHQWDEGKVTTPATCTENGVKTYTCSVCKETKTETVEKLGHAFGAVEVIKAPTCTETGVSGKRCQHEGCDVIDSETVLPATGHQWDKGKVTTEPTCTENGVKTYTCSVCSETKTETITATGHKWNDGEITTPATCEKDGEKTFTCLVCKETKTETIEKLGHAFGEVEVIKAPTCTETGISGKRCTHEGCEEIDSETVIPATGHQWDEGKVTTEPTCTEDGVKTYTCSVCDETKTETIAATGHQWNGGEITIPATCTENGVKTYTCSVCKETKTETVEKLGHAFGAVEVIKAPTCTETGISGKRCQHEGCEVIDSETVIPATGHQWDEGKVTTPATCTENGVKTYTCSVCKEIKTETLEKLGHAFGAVEVIKAPTCTETGISGKRCTHEGCDVIDSETVLPATDHQWDEGVVTREPTYTENGEKTFTCVICQTTRTETIPALTPEPDSVDLNEIAKDFDGSSIGVDVDGKTLYPDGEGNYPRLTVPEGTTTLISVSTCNLPEGVDPHTRYPVSMAVYKATNTDGTTSIERISEMDDLLRYAGSSIRITGNKGIRLITGIDASLKNALTSEGVAGYTLEEYGTLLCWASEVQNGSLSLSDGYARHNYAYSLANGTDPVFRYAGDVVQYTNVLVGFSNEQCVDDIAMRPYITLRDADGNTYTLYGGIVNRSIGYIAYQNRGAFTPGTNAYNYIWDIIHFVYGDAYDEDYKG